MPSIVTVVDHDDTGDICELDARYGHRREGFPRSVAEEMARLDDLIEQADVVPGDRIEVLVRILVPDPGRRKKVEKEVWIKPRDIGPDAVFSEIANGRFRVTGAPGSESEKSSWALFEEFLRGTKCVLKVRKEGMAG